MTMRLGTETGSGINHILSGYAGPMPVVGMGLTLLHWTDRSAGTVTRVHPNGKMFWFKEDIATRTDKNGMSEMQTYDYAPNPNATERVARLTKRGWKSVGVGIALGYRRAYHDYSF